MQRPITLYDTTLRDGAQGEGINFSLSDKLRIAERLDQFGVHYIEGGFPGSNPKDIEFYKAVQGRRWKQARIAAFGSTRRIHTIVEDDPQVRQLLESEAPVVTLVGKSWLLHVLEILKTEPEENLAMIADTVTYLNGKGREIVYDAEHFFDGYKDNPGYALDSLKAAAKGGASIVVLCDTNGGTIPSEISRITSDVIKAVDCPVGIHTHNDCGLGVANALASVEAGAVQVQGTVNGYGERTGNCNLMTLIPNLQLKLGIPVVTSENLAGLRDLSLFVDDIANQHHDPRAPFVGTQSFAHKGGLHANAVSKLARSYEHIQPEVVGNRQRVLVGELSGKSSVILKARDLGLNLDEQSSQTRVVLERVKELEMQGYEFEAADASFELLVKRALGSLTPTFEMDEYHVSIRKSARHQYEVAEATVKIRVKSSRSYNVAEGDGPVNALDKALREALSPFYPKIKEMSLIDYKVRIIDSKLGTEAKTRVLISSSDGSREWTTVGVSGNIIEASWIALVDSIEFFLSR